MGAIVYGLDDRRASLLLICSVRYALGRRSYVVSDVCDAVRATCGNIDANTQFVIRRDIAEELERAERDGRAGNGQDNEQAGGERGGGDVEFRPHQD